MAGKSRKSVAAKRAKRHRQKMKKKSRASSSVSGTKDKSVNGGTSDIYDACSSLSVRSDYFYGSVLIHLWLFLRQTETTPMTRLKL